jgi:hypothetical protein
MKVRIPVFFRNAILAGPFYLAELCADISTMQANQQGGRDRILIRPELESRGSWNIAAKLGDVEYGCARDSIK